MATPVDVGLDPAADGPYDLAVEPPSQSARLRQPVGFERQLVAVFPILQVGLVVLLALVPAGCGNDNGSGHVAGPPPKLLEVENGNFRVTTWVTFNGCELTMTFLENYWIQIDETGFSMGDWSGSWTADANSLTASGESEYDRVTLRDCTVTNWTAVSLDFTSKDAFSGDVIYRRRATGGLCECDICTDCVSAWGISGVRVVEQGAPTDLPVDGKTCPFQEFHPFGKLRFARLN